MTPLLTPSFIALIPKTARLLLAVFFFGGSALAGTIEGDQASMEPDLKSRLDILFFSGFESAPWSSVWAMAWGPEPPAQGNLVAGSGALSGSSLRVKYPQGTIGSGGGLQFLTDFSRFPTEPQESLYLRYYIRFEPGFDFVKGGKLPGLAGGAANTGGHKPNGTDGWSARVMWRGDGKIVQYVYHPDQPGDYGEDFDWNYGGCPRFFKPGQWQCLETYVRMNSPGKKDGVIRSWLDGEPALEVMNLRFRDTSSLKIDKMVFDTFFGGGDPSWATPRDQFAFFDNFVMAKNYIGPDQEAPRKTEAAASPPASGDKGKGSVLFDADSKAWESGGWSDGKYDFNSGGQNHTAGGKRCAWIALPDKAWGGAQFTGPQTDPKDFRTIAMWVMPTGCDVEYRVRFELAGTQTGVEKTVTAGPRHGWQVNQWNKVELPILDFRMAGLFDRVVLTSNSAKAVSPFYVDDIVLCK